MVDWPELRFYSAANAALPRPGPRRVVFLGDSITQRWDLARFFPEFEVINRGIGWQTTSEMLVRMRPDVVALKPAAVVVLGGFNDFHVDRGGSALVTVQNNVESMIELAHAHRIGVLVGTIPLVRPDLPASTSEAAAELVARYNDWLRTFCSGKNCVIVDFERALRAAGTPLSEYLSDCIHPKEKGYEIMAQAVRVALKSIVHEDLR
jgi:lysophospholipase L1-like esterase